MKVSKFVEMMQRVTIDNGEVYGRFGVVKQGQNYSLEYRGSR